MEILRIWSLSNPFTKNKNQSITILTTNNTDFFNTSEEHFDVNISKFGNCFISNPLQSVQGWIYNHSHDGCLLNILIENYMKTNIFRIFSIHFERPPSICQYKCGFPINAIKIFASSYHIYDQVYNRNQSACLTIRHCQYQDFYFILQTISEIEKPKGIQWILMIQDDIQLCPFAIDAILGIINGKISGIKWFFMGYGMTATLIKMDFIHIILKVLHSYIIYKETKSADNKWKGIDCLIWKKTKTLHQNMYMYNITSAAASLTWHPSGVDMAPNQSTLHHEYSKKLSCHSRTKWQDGFMKQGLEYRSVTTPTVSVNTDTCKY